jgi:RNA polymerase sigma-70 factor (ECF subfamily)
VFLQNWLYSYIEKSQSDKKRGDAMRPDVITRLLRHDEEAYSEIIHQYYRLVWAVVGSVMKDAERCTREDVEECVSDVFVALWDQPQKYDPARGSLKNYLCIIAKSKAANIRKKNSRSNVVYLEDYGDLVSEAEYSETHDYQALYAAIHALREPAREIMIRRYFHGQKPQKIADCMRLPKKQIENYLYNAKKTISDTLTRNEESVR